MAKTIQIDRRRHLTDEPRHRAQPLASRHRAGGRGGRGRGSRPRGPRRDGRLPDAEHHRGRLPVPTAGRDSSPHRAGPRQGRPPGRSAGGRVPRHRPQRWAFTAIMPGLGFLRDVMTTPFSSTGPSPTAGPRRPSCPACASPVPRSWASPGVAPSRAQVDAWARRETELAARNGFALPPDAGRCRAGLRARRPRTGCAPAPARERRQLRCQAAPKGASCSCPSRWRAPSSRPATATSPRATARCASPRSRWAPPAPCASACIAGRPSATASAGRALRAATTSSIRVGGAEKFVATMGMPVDEHGVNQGENLNLACRNAMLNMMQLLQERGFSREQAYSSAASPSICGSATSSTCRTSWSRRSCPRTSFRAEGRGGPLTITARPLYIGDERFRRGSHASSRSADRQQLVRPSCLGHVGGPRRHHRRDDAGDRPPRRGLPRHLDAAHL